MTVEMIVVGLGPAGCIFLACLPPEKLHTGIIAIERACVGGDLARLYGNVVANLTRTEMETAFQKVPAWATLQTFRHFEKYAPHQCPLLSDVCLQLRECMAPILAKITVRFAEVEKIQRTDNLWRISLKKEQLQTSKLIVCTGATPTQFDLPKSVIPLEIALSLPDLRQFIHPSHRIAVFGSSHSGTIVLRNIKDCGCENVTAFYKDPTPFRWARDGDPEGLKQESAVIADEIVAGAWGSKTPTLVHSSNMGSVLRHVMSADYVVYAMGFESRYPAIEGATFRHDSQTGALCEGAWGFGIGFPAMYKTPSGTMAPDVGFGQFADHIVKCLPALLAL
jgi:hypothetical protein